MARVKKEVEEKGKTIIEISDKMVGVKPIDEVIIEEIQDTIPEPEEEPEVLIPEPQMEEVKPGGPVKLKWKKIGGGSLRGIPDYPIIKPGQTFEAYLSDISPMFLKSLQCLDADLLAEQIGLRNTPVPKETTWKVQQVKTGAWNVINRHTDKPINVNPLPTKEDAEDLCKALNN
jgi:hypothetical protein